MVTLWLSQLLYVRVMCIVLPLMKGVNSQFTTEPLRWREIVKHTLFALPVFVTGALEFRLHTHAVFIRQGLLL